MADSDDDCGVRDGDPVKIEGASVNDANGALPGTSVDPWADGGPDNGDDAVGLMGRLVPHADADSTATNAVARIRTRPPMGEAGPVTRRVQVCSTTSDTERH